MSRAEPLNDSEWKLMHRVWESHPATAREVHSSIADDTGWAYTTVKTLLDRLVEKGVLESRMDGKASVYRPSLSRDDAQRGALRSMIDRVFEGAVGPFAHSLIGDGALGSRDLERLRELLAAETGSPAPESTPATPAGPERTAKPAKRAATAKRAAKGRRARKGRAR